MAQRPVLVDDILSMIGNTPLVRIRHAAGPESKRAAVWAKCEMLNPAARSRTASRSR